jgi:ankyrin repeat protein
MIFLSIVQMLLTKGADVNREDEDGETALYLASEEGHVSVVEILIDKGANIEHGRANDNGMTALTAASWEGHVPVVEILLAKGADANHQLDNGWTALMVACSQGHAKAAKILLENGAKVDLEANDGLTSLMLATRHGHVEIERMLLSKGADDNFVSSNERYVDELLVIDKREGLICSIGDGVILAHPFDKNGRHLRGREIGQILCDEDPTGDRMITVAESFHAKGGRKQHLDFCWHEIANQDGNTVWLA